MTPQIIAPGVRYLNVADTARIMAFFRDVLSFEIREGPEDIVAVRAPARVHLVPRGRPGSAVQFFETDDVAALRAAIQARGGNPSELQKVNWIKMRMFEVRDPDEHTPWFGQSYNGPHADRPRPMLQQALPEVPLNNVGAGIAHYRDVPGFHGNYQQGDLGVMDRDAVRLLLIAKFRAPRSAIRGGSATFACWISRATRSASVNHLNEGCARSVRLD